MKKSFFKSFVAGASLAAIFSMLIATVVLADAMPSASPSAVAAVVSVVPPAPGVATIQVPAWVVTAIHALQAIPAIGHLLVAIMGVMAIATPILTSLTALLMAIQKGFNIAGLLPEINFLNQKLIPWVAMFSNLNVQKPTSKDPTDPSVAVIASPTAPSDSKS